MSSDETVCVCLQELKKLILDSVTKTGKEAGLFSFEQVNLAHTRS